jgi:hypothetical protein
VPIHLPTGRILIAVVFLSRLLTGASVQAQEPVATSSAPIVGEETPPRPLSQSSSTWRSAFDEVLDQTAPPPAEPAHTGFKALVFETASDFNSFPRRTSTWVILAIGGAGAAIAHPYDKQVTESLVNSDAAGNFFAAGKYIGSDYVQVGTAVGLYVIGRYVMPHADGQPKTNKVSHLGFDLLRSLIVSQSLTQLIKVTVQRDRPTGECCSFPSGHASASFATASVFERHLGYRGAWPTYAIAGYVAMSRLHDNRHFLSDVIFGGALGIASGWTVVGRHGRSNFAMTPMAVPGGFMISFSRNPSPQPAF